MEKTFDYTDKENNLFIVSINDNKFIDESQIRSISINDDEITVIFNFIKVKSITLGKYKKLEEENVNKMLIIGYFNKYKEVNISLKVLNREGSIIESYNWEKTSFESLTPQGDNEYCLKTKIVK